MSTWERQAELFGGSSVMAVWNTAMLDSATRTARPLVQVIEQVLAQPFNTLSQHGSDLTGATCRSADGSIDAMLDVAPWGLSMPQAIGAAEAVIGLAARARRARMAIRMRAMRPFSARQAVHSPSGRRTTPPRGITRDCVAHAHQRERDPAEGLEHRTPRRPPHAARQRRGGGLSRLEDLIGEVTQRIPHRAIGQAIDLVIHISRTPGGRRVSDIVRVTGWGRAATSCGPLRRCDSRGLRRVRLAGTKP